MDNKIFNSAKCWADNARDLPNPVMQENCFFLNNYELHTFFAQQLNDFFTILFTNVDNFNITMHKNPEEDTIFSQPAEIWSDGEIPDYGCVFDDTL